MTEFLYRFLPPPNKGSQDEALLCNLITANRIRLSNPRYFNDPFDCRMTFAKGATSLSDLRAFIDSTMGFSTPEKYAMAEKALQRSSRDPEAAIEMLRKRVNVGQNDSRLDEYRLLCLFQVPNDSVSDDLLLWSHYADGHRGICLQFDKAILLAHYICKPITYETHLPSFNEYAPAVGESLAELVLFRKAKPWIYENEWRILVPTDKTNNDMIELPCSAISGIILGCQVDPFLEAQIVQWSIERQSDSLSLYKSYKHEVSYGLRIEPLVCDSLGSDQANRP